MIAHIIGLCGTVFIVAAYWLLTEGLLKTEDRWFYIINLIGAGLLSISLLFHFNLGSMVIEIFWILVSIRGLMRRAKT